MKYLLFFLVVFVVGLIIALCTNVAVALVCGIILAIALEVISEVGQMKTESGRKQISREIQREKDIEEYWGIIDYDDKKK